jgi:hypothetical protein
MSNSALLLAKCWRLFRRLCDCEKGREIFLSAKIQRNPLKRLDSDERIQGNPSFFNPYKQGFSRPKGHAPRKPKPVAPA